MPPPSGAFLTHTYKETKQSPVSLFLRPLKAARLDFSKSLLLPPAKKDRESEDAASRKSLPRWQGALSGARALARASWVPGSRLRACFFAASWLCQGGREHSPELEPWPVPPGFLEADLEHVSLLRPGSRRHRVP